jgi:hypothetical protein
MGLSNDGKIGTALALVGLGGGGALYVLPHPYADFIGWSLIAISVLGLLLLGLYHFRGGVVGPSNLILVGLVGAMLFLTVAIFGYVWSLYKTPQDNPQVSVIESLIKMTITDVTFPATPETEFV